MWSSSSASEFDEGFGGKQLAGMHPFALIKSDVSDEFFGLFFRSTNAQAPLISYIATEEDKDGNVTDGYYLLSYITTGGTLDINFFMRGTAKEIISSYQ